MLCRFLAFSKLLRGTGLLARATFKFSCPVVSESFDEGGAEFPELEEAELSARFEGLFGDVRFLETAFGATVEGLAGSLEDDFAERRDNLTLGRNGVASGDGAKRDAAAWMLCECDEPNCCDAMRRKEGDAGDGEFCEVLELTDASEPCEAVRFKLNFEGDRDRERLNDRTVAWTSICDG